MLDLIFELIFKYILPLSHQQMTQYVGNNNLLYVYWNYTSFVLLQPTDELNYIRSIPTYIIMCYLWYTEWFQRQWWYYNNNTHNLNLTYNTILPLIFEWRLVFDLAR